MAEDLEQKMHNIIICLTTEQLYYNRTCHSFNTLSKCHIRIYLATYLAPVLAEH